MTRKILFLFFYFIVSTYVWAQIEYDDDLEIYLDERLSSYSKDSTNYKLLSKVINNFNQSDKEEKSDIYKNSIGIAFVLSQEYSDITIFPAQYIHKEEKINISAVRSKEDKGLTEDMKEYVKKYLLNNFTDLIKVKLTNRLLNSQNTPEGIITENEYEYVINEPYSLSFIRGDDTWRYIVSVDKDFEFKDNSRIIIYAFKKSILGRNIFDTKDLSKTEIEDNQKELDRAKYPLYHDYRTDELRKLVKELLQKEPYKLDVELQRINSVFTKYIDRYNIKDYIPEFIYLSELHIEPNRANFYGKDELLNIKHLSVHALADYYFSTGEYEKALLYYEKAIFESPYEEYSGTTIAKDQERIIYDMSKVCYLSGRKDEAYGYLLALILDSQNYYKVAQKDIKTYFNKENENKKIFRKDLDMALKTIKEDERSEYFRVFKFRNKKIFFCPMFIYSAEEYEKKMKNSVFYKSL